MKTINLKSLIRCIYRPSYNPYSVISKYSLEEKEISSNKFFELYEKLDKNDLEEIISLYNKMIFHLCDDFRTKSFENGVIKVSFDGNGYAFCFYDDKTVKLAYSPHELYDNWAIFHEIQKYKDDLMSKLRDIENSYNNGLVTCNHTKSFYQQCLDKIVDEPKWIAEGYWTGKNERKSGIYLTKIFKDEK